MRRALLIMLVLCLPLLFAGQYGAGVAGNANRAVASVSRSTQFNCLTPVPDECDTGDHIQFNNVLVETNTTIIDCDIATAYTKTDDVPSIGRCQIKVAGTYELIADIQFETADATEAANMQIRDTTNAAVSSAINLYPPDTSVGPRWTSPPRVYWVRAFTSAQVPAWIEVKILASASAAGLTKVQVGSYFNIRRLE